MTKTNNRGSVLLIIGALAIIAALSLIVYNKISDSSAASHCQEVVARLRETMPEVKENALGSIHSSDGNLPVAEIEGEDYCGIVEIPALGIELPILDNSEGAKGMPARYFGSAYTKNLVLCGNNSGKQFAGISRLKSGDLVTFTDVDGNLFKYKVLDLEILNNYDTEGMMKGDWDLSIFTGNLTGSKLEVLRCIYG